MPAEGTDSRVMRWTRGACAACPEYGVLVYELEGMLVCAADYRRLTTPPKQACDKCGSTGNVWRDPVHRRNEYLCVKCHDPEALFQNRWANKARESVPLGIHPKATCYAAGITECKGEVKPRGAFEGRLVCNKHAGKQGVGPNG